MTKTDFPLWDFSLDIYARPGVAPHCLALQDRVGADISILLWCLWLERQYIPLDLEKLNEALHLVSPWAKETIIPLRQLRRQLKNDYGTADARIENLRQTIKQAELQAEQQEQFLLQNLAANWNRKKIPLSPGKNLSTYLNTLVLTQEERDGFIADLLLLI